MSLAEQIRNDKAWTVSVPKFQDVVDLGSPGSFISRLAIESVPLRAVQLLATKRLPFGAFS
jgi:hypothetical protein